MAKTDLKLYATDTQGKSTTASITYVNPEATNDKLLTLGKMINNLTSNTYGKTDRINTINCDTESGGGAKQTATITLSPESVTKAEYEQNQQSQGVYLNGLTYTGDGDVYSVSNSGLVYTSRVATDLRIVTPTGVISAVQYPVTIKLYAPETDNFKAAEATFTITE